MKRLGEGLTKQRVCIELDSALIKAVDARVDGHVMRSRSHAIEQLLKRALGAHAPKVAVILAGGRGTRLQPITYEIPKPLIPVQGKAIVEHLLDLLKKYDVRDIMLAVGHMAEKIKAYFGDGSRFGVRITYIEEAKPLGTAGPLRAARRLLTQPFIVSNGDELKNIDIFDMHRVHHENKALATIALTAVKDPSAYGVARLEGARICEFVEKPRRGEAPSNLINAGLYMFEPAVLKLIPRGFAMLERDVFPRLAKMGRLYGYPFSGQWFDTGNLERYEVALKEWRGIT